MKRCFCASVPYWMIAGPTHASPMKQMPRGGAFRFAISSLRITCSMIEPPPPPTSFGHEKPTQRFSRTLRFQSARNFGSLGPGAGRQVLVEERAHLGAERLFLGREMEVHHFSPR